jgi:hypothetical protein
MIPAWANARTKMKQSKLIAPGLLALFLILSFPNLSHAWHNETHLAVAKAAGY